MFPGRSIITGTGIALRKNQQRDGLTSFVGDLSIHD